jgi:hypothetical protein
MFRTIPSASVSEMAMTLGWLPVPDIAMRPLPGSAVVVVPAHR